MGKAKYKALEDDDLMPFGTFKGRVKMANLEAGYLQWVKDNVKRNDTTGPVLQYIRENWDAIKKEL